MNKYEVIMSKFKIQALKENDKPVMMPRLITIPGLTDIPTYRKLQRGEPVEVEPETAEYLILNHFCELYEEKLFQSEEEK
jgi:hypothetical protein